MKKYPWKWNEFLLLLSLMLVAPTASTKSNSNGRPACSLNGDLVDSKCVCDKPWTGVDCGILDVKPVAFPQGYGMEPNKTTWGADLFATPTHSNNQEETTQYHLFVSSITGGCSLRSWGSHSRIEHAVADEITGPYRFHDIALPTFAHNPKLVDLSFTNDGALLALVHIGDGAGPDDAGNNCRKPPEEEEINYMPFTDLMETSTTTNQRKRELLGGSSNIHLATSVNGPWTPLLNNTLGGCNNPSPFVYHNHTDDHSSSSSSSSSSSIYVVCSGGNHSVLKQADHIWGPWKTLSQITPFPKDFDNKQSSDSDHLSSSSSSLHYEDPTFYIDAQRNAFHVIYHVYDTKENPPHGHDCTQSTVSAHLFSPDGSHWYKSRGQPYGTQVEILTMSSQPAPQSQSQSQAQIQTITLATRERPSLVFETQKETGKTIITHLVTAVCSAPNCPDGPPEGCVNCKYDHWDYTLIQPLNV